MRLVAQVKLDFAAEIVEICRIGAEEREDLVIVVGVGFYRNALSPVLLFLSNMLGGTIQTHSR